MSRPIIGYVVEAATKLFTKRKIGGVDFDGSSDIDLPGVNEKGTQDTSGNAATATKLAKAINLSIGGDVESSVLTFDGGKDIKLNTTLITVSTSKTSGSANKIPVVTVDSKGRVTRMSEIEVTGGGNFDIINTDLTILPETSVEYDLLTILGDDVSKFDLTKLDITALVLDDDPNSPTNGLYINSEAVLVTGVSKDRMSIKVHNSRSMAVESRVRIAVGMSYEEELQPATVNIFDDPNLLQTALNTIRPVTQKDIFDTWPRFSYTLVGGNQLYWENPADATGEAAAWTFDGATGQVNMPRNTAVWNGFISQKKYDRYVHEVTIGSPNNDDDWNGVIIGHVWSGGVNHILMVMLSTSNHTSTWPGSEYSTNIVAYHGGKLDIHKNAPNHWDSITHVRPITSDPKLSGGWNGRERRIGVFRDGDEVTIKLSNWNEETYNEEHTTIINLNDLPEYTIFKGPQSYGYSNMSQPATYYRDIFFDGGERPDNITYAPTKEVYAYDPVNGWTVDDELSLVDAYGAPRVLIDSTTGDRYKLNEYGNLVKLPTS